MLIAPTRMATIGPNTWLQKSVCMGLSDMLTIQQTDDIWPPMTSIDDALDGRVSLIETESHRIYVDAASTLTLLVSGPHRDGAKSEWVVTVYPHVMGAMQAIGRITGKDVRVPFSTVGAALPSSGQYHRNTDHLRPPKPYIVFGAA